MDKDIPGGRQTDASVENSAWWLAVYVLRVAKAHNEAYDRKAAERATKDAPFGTHINYRQFQTKTVSQCAADCVPEPFVTPVALMLMMTWNDAQEWALALLEKDAMPKVVTIDSFLRKGDDHV